MNVSLVQIIAAIAMVGVTIALVFAYRRYLAANSERRLQSMLHSVGLDPVFAPARDIETVMKDLRQRCRSCASEDVCERWLRGEEKGNNAFCPNSRIFEVLAAYRAQALLNRRRKRMFLFDYEAVTVRSNGSPPRR